jgi:uncharacterized protein YjiS (DUF1127 family)
MPCPSSDVLDIRTGISPLVPVCLPARPEKAGLARRIANAFGALLTRYLAWRARQVTLRVLSSLDAATLRDLGITDIESAVNGAPQGRARGYEPDWWRRIC